MTIDINLRKLQKAQCHKGLEQNVTQEHEQNIFVKIYKKYFKS